MRPFIIGIGGGHSGAGKTSVACNILKSVRGFGAIKFTKTPLYSSIVDDPDVLNEKGKDTRRLLDAGAEEVLWVRSSPETLGESISIAVERLARLKGIVVEGNSAIEVLKPDIVIFIFGEGPGRMKEGSWRVLRMSDAVILKGRKEPGILPEGKREFGIDDVGAYTAYIRNIYMKEELIRKINERAQNGRIPCQAAREIAEDAGVPYGEVGKLLNELKIKITDCGLGCF
jgi:molybdopterin-guanine dinucleotide biosynthesis protein